MRTVAGILILLSGVVFPMGMLFWLNGRFNRVPAPRPIQVGLMLALNGVLPVALITLGLALMAERLWATHWLRVVIAASWAATMFILVGLAIASAVTRRGVQDV